MKLLKLVPDNTNIHFLKWRVPFYIASLLLPAITYTALQRSIRLTGDQSPAAQRYHLATSRKGLAATALYALGLGLAAISPWIGIGCAGLVAVLWFLPSSRLDRVFLACDDAN